MRTWITLHLPLLPLEALRPCWSDPVAHVLIEKERVLVMNALAEAGGVRLGIRRGGVSALIPNALVQDRDLEVEKSALDSIALALLQFTPEVAHADEWSLLLDVTTTLRLFKGRLAICRRIKSVISEMGFTCRLAMAPTAQGAWLLARCIQVRGPQRFIHLDTLTRRLDRLPCALLPAAAPYREWLDGIGCLTLGDLRKLPRAGLQRRCNKHVLNELDRAYGEAPELFEWVQAPPSFSARLELPSRVEYAEAVMFAAKRLILQLAGWLVAQQLSVLRLVLQLEHERGKSAIPPTPVEIVLAQSTWQDEHLVSLLKERLGQLQLIAPVIALRLDATQVEPMAPANESLFPEPGGTASDFNELLELLVARLGRDAVMVPAPRDDHRPEAENRWVPAIGAKKTALVPAPQLPRPFWLFNQPLALIMRGDRPFYGSPLKLIAGPERVECGWWDGALVVRDYFIAQGCDKARYWIYRERATPEARWFLHGLFG